jgi:hypothetical protein
MNDCISGSSPPQLKSNSYKTNKQLLYIIKIVNVRMYSNNENIKKE